MDPTDLLVDFPFDAAEDFGEAAFEAPFALLFDDLEEAVTVFCVELVCLELRRFEDDVWPFEPAALDVDLDPF
ncbi:MAG: hypothetical protein L7U72_05550 [Rubripirellula sp.]|nr:hypothetical protein [Rubripirellula sp.]